VVSVCPAAVVEAPVERVWAVLTDSRNYGDWADARFTRINPPGPATPGQVLEADTRELGVSFKVRLRVEAVNPAKHQVVFDVSLPFGIKERTTITATRIDQHSTRVQFG
jgi:uncharacterized protein YndB with AHSA1/START domain